MAQRLPACLLPRRPVRLLAVLALVVALSLAPKPAAAATNWYVATTGNDAADCMAPLTPCMTIQAAVTKASSGDTINVAAGLYPESAPGPLTINKTLTLLGAQSGVDARTRVGAESIIGDVQGTSVSASGVVIDGFTVQDSSVSAFTGYGIWLNPGVSGTQIVDNIIQDNIVGIGLANTGASQAVIRHNLIRDNTRPGGASGSGIYTDQFSGGPTVRNVLINENSFLGHSGFGAAINISNEAYAIGGVFDLTVSSNLFDANGRAFLLFNTHTSTFDHNTISNSSLVGSADVRIFDGNTALTFTNNDLTGGVGHAIRLSVVSVGGPSSDVEFHQNNIEVYGLTGLTVDPASHTGTVDATCNWWNSSTGPANPGNPGGTGEEVVGDADFTPWLIAPAPGGLCIGPAPTSGKGTGGGQVPGPANFGFNAQVNGGVSSGHFEFNERGGPAHHCDVTLVTAVTANTIDFDVSCNTGPGHVRAEDDQRQGSGAGADKLFFTQGTSTNGGTLVHGQVTIHN